MGRILTSAFADEYSPSLDAQLAMLRRRGFDFLEPRFIDGVNIADLTSEQLKTLRSSLEHYRVSVYSVGSPIGKISVTDPIEPHLARAENCFRIASRIGATRVRVFSFYIPEGSTPEQCRGEVLVRMEALISLAEKYGLLLCHENEAGIYGETPERCLDLLEHFGGRLRAVFDMGNFVLDGCEPYPHAYKLLRDYIDYFHIKDALSAGAIVPPSLGEARIADILAEHSVRGGDTVVTLEPHLETFSGLNRLVGKSFDNPHKFASPEEAFVMAHEKLTAIIDGINHDV